MKKIVELKNVSKTYKTGENEFKALDNNDLDINKGEFVVILGTSGAGKSTLLNLIRGMDPSTEGSIKIDVEERFIATVACKAAVKANMDLSVPEVENWLYFMLA